ncbi:hypothetical protein CCR75_002808 [Bremia lactucae]|uniref:Uncharacterized protein n=1 Tax=Bremia lactucae TaxID=4779 RepID=A0A976IGH7_BRELC|nr:hypothetical protein CCR75_002808 [Bremia lactucae]
MLNLNVTETEQAELITLSLAQAIKYAMYIPVKQASTVDYHNALSDLLMPNVAVRKHLSNGKAAWTRMSKDVSRWQPK